MARKLMLALSLALAACLSLAPAAAQSVDDIVKRGEDIYVVA